MSEFDFDELDKAVNSLMQKRDTGSSPAPRLTASSVQTTEDTQSSEETATTLRQLETEPVTSTQTTPNPKSESADTSEVPDAQPPVPTIDTSATGQFATKRRGQFMDVMHPSANMSKEKDGATSAQSAKPPVRRSATLQPMSTTLTPDVVTSRPPEVATATDETASDGESSNWPDPIDSVEESAPAPTPPSNDESLDDLSLPQESDDSDSSSDESRTLAAELEADSKSMVSPFLPDAKVEKRPLGGDQITADEVTDTLSSNDVEAEAGATVSTNLDVAPTPTSADSSDTPSEDTLPDELSSPMMDVEADSTAAEEQSAEQTSEPSSDGVEATDQATAVDTSSAQPAPAFTPAANQLVGALPPRQTSTSKTEDEPEVKTSIYDTDDHGHMKHAEKHSSGWFAVIVIGSMLVIGAVGGVILFLLNNGY